MPQRQPSGLLRFGSLPLRHEESLVALGLSVFVVDRRWDDFWYPVFGHAQVPALVFGGAVGVGVGFDEAVVGGADEGGVVEAGGSAGGPRLEVVGVAVAWFAWAAGKDTAAVAEHDRLTQVTAEQPGGTTQVQQLRVRSHDRRKDVRITGEVTCLGRADPDT